MTTKAEVLKSVRAFCIGCSAGSRSEVARCHLQHCELWHLRFGRDPTPSKRGFAKNHSASREVLSGKSVPPFHQSSEKDNPPKAGTSDGSKPKTLTGDLEVVGNDKHT